MTPTPETDAAERMAYSQEYMVPTEVARRLERERDEAREKAEWADMVRDEINKYSREGSSSISCYWDHSNKPSVFVVKNSGVEIYRGPYTDGYKIYKDRRNVQRSRDERI